MSVTDHNDALTPSEPRSMEEGSQAYELSESEISMYGGGAHDDDLLLSPNSESMNPPPEMLTWGNISILLTLYQMIKSIDYLPSHLCPPSITNSHSVTSMGRIVLSDQLVGEIQWAGLLTQFKGRLM